MKQAPWTVDNVTEGRTCVWDQICANADETRVCRDEDTIFYVLADAEANADTAWEKPLFTATFLLFSNNNTKKFQLQLQFFAHATLLKAAPGFQYIVNIITVAGSADANVNADASQLRFVKADTTLRTRTQNFRIRTSLLPICCQLPCILF